MVRPYQFQHPAPKRRQPGTTLGADSRRTIECVVQASVMVMALVWKRGAILAYDWHGGLLGIDVYDTL